MPKQGDKKRLGKGLGALIRHYDLDEKEVKEAAKETKKEEPRHEKKKAASGDQEMGRLSVYKKALQQAHHDGKISDDEKDMLAALRTYLMIDETEHDLLEEQVLRKLKK
jgi:hypothetical protein